MTQKMKMLVQTSKDPNWKHGWGFKGMDAQELGFVSSAGRVVYYPVESLPCGISNGRVLLCCFHIGIEDISAVIFIFSKSGAAWSLSSY